MNEIEELLKNTPKNGPTHFQLQYFVIGKEPTLQSKMHKCIQEIRDRYNAIKNIELEIEELNDQTELISLSIKTKSTLKEDVIRNRQIGRKIKASDMQIESLKVKMNAYQEEIRFLKELFDRISDKVQLKSWDSPEVQLEYWNEKMTQEIRQRVIMGMPVDMETIKTIVAFPDQMPIKKQLLDSISEKEKLC